MAFKVPGFVRKIHRFLDSIHIPMLGISLWRMFQIYGTGIFKNDVIKQASSISWSFFLSLFPFILFLLSILPYLPHYDKLQFYIFEVLMESVFPSTMKADVADYIQNSILPNMKSISNLTILLALIFATNGTYSLISGFNENTDAKRGVVREYIISFFITLSFITIIFLTLFGVYYSEVVLKLFTPAYTITWFIKNLSALIGFISFPIFYFILLMFFYWAGTVKITRLKHAIPGTVFTTVLFLITTYLFAFYVKEFATYNVLYGSIGSIILLMLWVNVNVILLLLGNELNITLRKVRIEKIISDELHTEIRNYRSEPTEPDEPGPEHTVTLDRRQ